MTHHYRVLTKKELKHFQFVFDRMHEWKESVNSESEREGIMYKPDVIGFKKFWNETVGKHLNELEQYMLENWLIVDKQLGLVDIAHYKRWNRLD